MVLQFYIQIPEFMNTSSKAIPGPAVVTMINTNADTLRDAGFTIERVSAVTKEEPTTIAPVPRQKFELWKWVVVAVSLGLVLTLIIIIIVIIVW